MSKRRMPQLRWIGPLAVGLVLLAGGQALASTGPNPNLTDHPGLHGSLRQLTANPDCTLWVPQNPLSAQGLATPYVLGSAGMHCSESDEGTAAFVQATILDPATGALSVYNPVVRNAGQALQGTTPPVPVLPTNAVVTVWTGFNANTLKLTGPGSTSFVNFAQQAYANSAQFFTALNAAVGANLVKIPPLGVASDGKTCPSLRDASVVDQDQSDNTTTVYSAYGTSNGSDDALLEHIDAALGCTPWQVTNAFGAPDNTSGTLEEAQAAAYQGNPSMLVPALDPFVLSGGQPDLALQNLYRQQLGQSAESATGAATDTARYCNDLANAGEPRLKLDAPIEAGAPAPQFAPIAASLDLVLAGRFAATWGNLSCQALTGQPSPITVTTNEMGLVTAAVYK